MKRFISLLGLAMLLAGNVALPANATTTYSGIDLSNAFADAVIYNDGSDTFEKTTDGSDTGVNDVTIGQHTGEVLYFGFDQKFDGITIDVGTAASGGKYIIEYWNGSSWATLVSETTASIQNDSSTGVFNVQWERPDSWAKTTINMDFAEDSDVEEASSSLYFARLRITSDYSTTAEADQLGILNYNVDLDIENPLGADVEMALNNVYFSSSTGDVNVYAAKNMSDSDHAYALYTPSSTSYTYTIKVPGFVQESATGNFSETTSIISESLDYAYLATVENSSGSTITDATVKMGDDSYSINCTYISNGQYGCITPISNDLGKVQISASGYTTTTTTFSSPRDSDSDPQVTQSFTLSSSGSTGDDEVDLDVESMDWEDDGDFVFVLQNEGDEDVDEDENVYVSVYVDGDREYYEYFENDSSSSFLNAGEDETINLGDDFLADEDEEYTVEACVDATDTVDETDEDNNCYEKTLELGNTSTDGVDLEMEDMYMDDEDLVIEVTNSGDEDVDDSETIAIYVYVDGDLEYTLVVDENDGDEADFFQEGETSKINVGDNVFDDHGNNYDVEACVDVSDAVDEADEDNNCREEDDEELEEGPGSSDDTCEDFTDIDGHWGEEYICNLFDREVVQGYSKYYFGPDADVSRAEFLKMALLGADKDPYSTSGVHYDDVSSSAWYYDYVTYATTKGYVEGYDDGDFRPNEDISRSEALVILLRIAGEDDYDYDSHDIDFSDVETYDWFAWAVVLADELDLVEGYSDGSFRPDDDLSRAEAAKIVDLAYEEFYQD
ncbi:MAG: S-layer homology domain-containing protein [Candidatus Gracilibacteria bacterium]